MPRWERPTLDGSATAGTGTGHRTKAEESLTTKTAAERYERLLLQNEKLRSELATLKGGSVDLETIKRQVIGANRTTKQHVLALPEQLAIELSVMTDPHMIRIFLTTALTRCLNELAFQQGT